MRREYKHPKNGDVRTRTAFLWLPMTIYDARRDISEMRWLETATWEEMYDPHPYLLWQFIWVPKRWL